MYLLIWNPEHNRIEASFGGKITPQEARRFDEELAQMLAQKPTNGYDVMVDMSTMGKASKAVQQSLYAVRETCLEYGANKVKFILGQRELATEQRAERLEQVMAGREQYLDYYQAG